VWAQDINPSEELTVPRISFIYYYDNTSKHFPVHVATFMGKSIYCEFTVGRMWFHFGMEWVENMDFQLYS